MYLAIQLLGGKEPGIHMEIMLLVLLRHSDPVCETTWDIIQLSHYQLFSTLGIRDKLEVLKVRKYFRQRPCIFSVYQNCCYSWLWKRFLLWITRAPHSLNHFWLNFASAHKMPVSCPINFYTRRYKSDFLQVLHALVNSADHYRVRNICPTGKLNCKSHWGKLLCCATNSSYLDNSTGNVFIFGWFSFFSHPQQNSHIFCVWNEDFQSKVGTSRAQRTSVLSVTLAIPSGNVISLSPGKTIPKVCWIWHLML